MRCEFDVPSGAFALVPPQGDGVDETVWVREQIEAYRGGPLERDGLSPLDYGDAVAHAARLALATRVPGATDLFFRPVDQLVFGVVHLAIDSTPTDLGDRDLVEWVLQGVELRVDPVVGGFSTETIREGWRVHYVTARDDENGDALAGFAFVFEQDDVTGVVYSELAPVDSISEQLVLTTPVVASLRFVE